MKVVIPVTPVVPNPTESDNIFVSTATVLNPDIPEKFWSDRPVILTTSKFFKLWGEVVIPSNLPLESIILNTTFSKFIVEELIDNILFSDTSEIFADAPNPPPKALSNTNSSFTE